MPNWYAHHLGDYAKKTSSLTMLEHGAYRLLIDFYYSNNGPFTNDVKMLYRVCGAFNPKERAAVSKILSKYFLPENGIWRHERCDEEILKSSNISELRKKAACKRYAKAPANAEQKHTQPTTTTNNHSYYKKGEANGKPKSGAEAVERIIEGWDAKPDPVVI